MDETLYSAGVQAALARHCAELITENANLRRTLDLMRPEPKPELAGNTAIMAAIAVHDDIRRAQGRR